MPIMHGIRIPVVDQEIEKALGFGNSLILGFLLAEGGLAARFQVSSNRRIPVRTAIILSRASLCQPDFFVCFHPRNHHGARQ